MKAVPPSKSARPPRPSVERRPYQTGTVSPVFQGGRWRYRARFPDGAGGVISAGTFDSESAAAHELNGLVLARRGQQHTSAAQTLRTFGELWIAKVGHANKQSEFSTWGNTVAAAPFVDYPLDSITVPDVRDWARKLPEYVSKRTGKPIARETAKHALGLVRRCLAEAVQDGLIDRNVAIDIELPERGWTNHDREPWTFLTPEEIDQMLEHDALPPKQRSAFATAIYQGLRQGELAAMRWERVRWSGPRAGLDVLAGWDEETKTRTSRRLVPLTELGRAALAQWWEHEGRPTSGPVWPSTGPRTKGKARHHARGYDWGWAPHTDCARGLTSLGWRYRVGLRRRVRFHDLRHTCASALISGYWGAPWPMADIATFLGHAHNVVTERYAHLDPAALQARARGTGAAAPIGPESDRAETPKLAQVVEITGRAVRDSNARLSAPEREANATIPDTCGGPVRFRSDSPRELATALVRRIGNGEPIDRAAADALAAAVLTRPEVVLAGQLAGAAADDLVPLVLRLAAELMRAPAAAAAVDGAAPAGTRREPRGGSGGGA